MGTYLLNTPQIDYLTVSTRSLGYYELYRERLFSISKDFGVPSRPSKLLDYVGACSADGSITVLSRMCSGVPQYLIQLSGPRTSELAMAVVGDDEVRHTRVDVAYMSSTNDYPKPQELLLLLSSYGVPCEVRSDERSLQTLYVGERTRTRFIRIYEKEIGGRTYIRFELELKKDLARRVAVHALQSTSVRYGLLAASFDKLPLEVQTQLAFNFEGTVEKDKATVKECTPETYRDWFKETVVPSLLKRMRNHEAASLGGSEYAMEYSEILSLLQEELDIYIENVRGVEERQRGEVVSTNSKGKKIRARLSGPKEVPLAERTTLAAAKGVWQEPVGYED